MSQLLKMELLNLVRNTARRMRDNSGQSEYGQDDPFLSLATQLEQEADELEIATLH